MRPVFITAAADINTIVKTECDFFTIDKGVHLLHIIIATK
jgi:hypothetical protein